MADFELQLDIVALTAQLDKSLKEVEKKIAKTADKVDEMASGQKGMAKFAATAGKAVAAFAAIEIGAKAFNATGQSILGIMDAFRGNTEDAMVHFEGALNAAKQLPFGIGGAVDAVHQLSLAIAGVEEQLRHVANLEAGLARIKAIQSNAAAVNKANRQLYEDAKDQFAIMQAQNDSEKERISLSRSLAAQIKEIRKEVEQATKQEGMYIEGNLVMSKGQADIIRKNGEATIAALIDEYNKRLEILRTQEKQAALDKEKAAMDAASAELKAAIQSARRAELADDEEGLRNYERRLEYYKVFDDYEKRIAEATKEGNAELAKNLAEYRDAIIAEQERQQAAEDRLRIEKELTEEAEKQAEVQKKLAEDTLKAQQEIQKARSEAESSVAGATATFSTAGGSFTTAVNAQVSEAKLLTKISQQSKDLLVQIVTNTARMAMGGVSLA
jgi:hypothetical protein